MDNDLGLPGLAQDKIDAARKAGWTDKEISSYWSQRNVTRDVEPAKPSRFSHLSEKNINRQEGEEFWPRLLASFKSTPQERLAFWKSYRGDQGAVLTPAGEILVRGSKGWKPVDEDKLTMADIADLAGDVPEVASMMIGKMPAGFLKAVGAMAGKTGLGNVAKQTVGSQIQGDANRTSIDRLGEVTTAAAGGGLSELFGRYLGAGGFTGTTLRQLRKQLEERLDKLGQGHILKESVDLSNKTGFPLDLAEASQDPMLKVLKGFAERQAFGQPIARAAEKEKDLAAQAYMERLLGELGKKPGDPSLGQAAGEAAASAMKSLKDRLSKTSDNYFSFLREGGGAVSDIPVSNYRAALEKMLDYYKPISHRGETVRELEQALKNISPIFGQSGGATNARTIQDLLMDLGQESWGREGLSVFKNLKNSGSTRELKQLHKALRDDLVAAESAMPPSQRAIALKQARSEWDKAQSSIDELQATPLVKFLEGKGMLKGLLEGAKGNIGHEHVSKALLEGMRSGSISPSEISNLTRIMSATNSDFPHKLAGGLLDEALAAGRASAADRPAQFSYKASQAALPSPAHLQAIYQDIWEPGVKSTGAQVQQGVTDLLKVMERSGAPGQGLPAAPQTLLLNILGNVEKMKEGSLKSAFKSAVGHIVLPRKYLQWINDPEVMQRISQGGAASVPFEQGFLPTWARDRLAPVLYEMASASKPLNQPGVGEEPVYAP